MENVLSASKFAFETTNSPSDTSTQNFGSFNPKLATPSKKSNNETMPTLGLSRNIKRMI
ncbi:hypothetical protein [Vibrio parahaemolyticus]|uniref:hypothetical protein n=1 Tax=Vibrio parahaemolyticus TaxID=670 RepID=UPI001A33D3FD|nr:hypothetical protein [Vibrio parahaemolyticus]EID0723791.1 hypothetical protein [Vibrio parahaemolyticus]EJG1587690.1 hypothetical protein [Vibrio parahaemolyticus]HCH3521510.1 hypothetical protein [Vibrio parahaemolyticus]HCH6535868.1 hypothetical protein [Vibrio parahaemolyticus]